MDTIMDVLTGVGVTAIVGIVSGILASWLKKGQFYNYGVVAGKWVSKFLSAKIGKDTWEKIEDIISTTVLSFADGFKDGADWDDTEVNNLMKTSNRDGLIELKSDNKPKDDQ